MGENWYLVLGLDFDPPVEDEQKISEKIEECSKFWSSNFTHYQKGAQYRGWYQALPQIRKDMLGPNNIRKQLAEEACVKAYEPVDKLLKTIGRKGYITSEEMDKIAKKFGMTQQVIKSRVAKQKIPQREKETSSEDYQAVYNKYYKVKPPKTETFEGMAPMLVAFQVEDLYQFLSQGSTMTDTRHMPADKLLQRSAERKQRDFVKNDSKSGTGSKLCNQCDLAFANETSKQIYDQYLDYKKRREVLDNVKGVAEISGELSVEQWDVYVGQLTQILLDRELAEKVLTAFCKVCKIPFTVQADDHSHKKSFLKVCRCGCINDVSDGRKVCQNCGLELVIKCPKCGTENENNVKVCKCGFPFANLDKSRALCQQADASIQCLDLQAARGLLGDAERYWSQNSMIKTLREQLAEYERRAGDRPEKLREAMEQHRYWEARSQMDNLKRLFPGYQNARAREEIDQAISKAQNLMAQAKATKEEQTLMELCAQAYELCSDLPGVRELIPQPKAVKGLTVKADPRMRANILSWTAEQDHSLVYVVVRSESGWVQRPVDGKILYRGSGDSFADKAIQPGTAYYYNVFAQRAGIYSPAAKGETAVNLFELSSVTAAAADGSLQLSWGTLPQGAAAEVYQVAPNGAETLAATSLSDGYLAEGLQNGQLYRFHVRLVYQVQGKRQVTKGITVSGMPDHPPQPIDTLQVTPLQEGLFEATWFQDEEGEVRLYGSPVKPKYALGDTVSLESLEREMRPLQQRPLSPKARQQLRPGQQGAAFQYSGDQLLYVSAVVMMTGSGVFGSLSRAGVGETVTIKDVQPVNGKIHLYVDPPKDATGFVVLYRHDVFAADIGDVNTVRKYIPLKQYQLNSAIVLDTLEPKKYYFSVFAEFRRDGERDYSLGANYLFDNTPKETIVYSIAVSKRLFGENTVTLEFEAGNHSFELPAIDVMSAVGNTPMFKKSASLFYTIPAQHVDGTLRVRIPMPKGLAKNTYIKPFIKEESGEGAGEEGSHLQVKLGSTYKIS